MTTTDTPEFGFIADHQADLARKARVLAIQNQRDNLRCCWPEWAPEVGGRCEVGGVICFSITHNDQRYHYGAPCRIIEISPDCETFVVEVDYPEGAGAWCFGMNGERLRLDITEIWAPTVLLHSLRK